MARPTRKQSRRLLSSLSIIFLAFLALLFLCPVGVQGRTEAEKVEGHIIGIGQ